MTDPKDHSIIICGLPASGKTTFLAALWHVVVQRVDSNAKLKFDSLKDGDHSHLNAITRRWQQAKEQIHTETASGKLVSMKLKDNNGGKVRMTFPDLSGESYQRMWEDRECDPQLAQFLSSGEGVLLFVHANGVKHPIGVAEVAAHAAALGGGPPEPTVSAKWHPKDAPTAVQVVEMLQMLRCNALRSPARRIAIMLSAWDKVEEEGLDPEAFLARELPLLDQYLRQGEGNWEFRIYGLSAQGSDYEPNLREGEMIDPDLKAKVDAIREIEEASARIRLFAPSPSTDLTEPLAWLTE
ncbi:TRAFAC clade GTPase domain-containing protein [Tardiphaga sp. 285_C5_N1_2]|uniref:TRAFAC clade GTPase domain-containing protein n=1 Tax=Tardiphaga sp. 285_C5_N1_2 TaxID=3240775 RepID=UPI003F88C8E1